MNKTLTSFLFNEMRGICKKAKLPIWDCGVSPDALGLLIRLVDEGYLKRRQMGNLVEKWVMEAKDEKELVVEFAYTESGMPILVMTEEQRIEAVKRNVGPTMTLKEFLEKAGWWEDAKKDSKA